MALLIVAVAVFFFFFFWRGVWRTAHFEFWVLPLLEFVTQPKHISGCEVRTRDQTWSISRLISSGREGLYLNYFVSCIKIKGSFRRSSGLSRVE